MMDINTTLVLFSLIATALVSFVMGAILGYLGLKMAIGKLIYKAYTREEANEILERLRQVKSL